MKVKALKPLNNKGKTVKIGSIIELEDSVAKKLIANKSVEAVAKVEAKTEIKAGDQK